MRTVFTYGSTESINGSAGQSIIKLEQSDARGKLFRVTYGMQVKRDLTYSKACAELGACILHHLACDSLIDNDGE